MTSEPTARRSATLDDVQQGRRLYWRADLASGREGQPVGRYDIKATPRGASDSSESGWSVRPAPVRGWWDLGWFEVDA